MSIIILHYFQTLFLNLRSFTGNFDISAAATYIIFLACVKELTLPQLRCWKGGGKHTKLHIYHLLIDYFSLVICWRKIVDFPCWKLSLKVIHLTWGQLFGNHGMLYIISNLPKVATWRSKGFRIGPLIAEKSTTLLFTGTLGHTVVWRKRWWFTRIGIR